MLIKNIMTRNPVYIAPDTSVNDAKTVLDKERISHLPVLNKKDELCGIVTRRDLIKAGPSPATTLDIYEISYLLSKLKVENVMVKDVITIDDSDVVEEAARIMVDHNISCLPVMRGTLLAGIITAKDLLVVLINAFGARKPGVRIAFELDEKPGQFALLASGIAQKGGNIQSFITSEGDDLSKIRATCKLYNINAKDAESALTVLSGIKIEDIR